MDFPAQNSNVWVGLCRNRVGRLSLGDGLSSLPLKMGVDPARRAGTMGCRSEPGSTPVINWERGSPTCAVPLFRSASTPSYSPGLHLHSHSLPVLRSSTPVDKIMTHSLGGREWKTDLFDPGEGSDCARSCFVGCDQFSRTRYRLDQLDRHQDALDLSNRNSCNQSCCNYFLLCIGGLCMLSPFPRCGTGETFLCRIGANDRQDIGSGVYTGSQTRRVRKAYGIQGTYFDDLAKGIFCQPCSLIRNDLEIRRRETEEIYLHLAAGLRPPMPLGEENYRPIYAMPTSEGYQREPRMTTSCLPFRGGETQFFSSAEPCATPLSPESQGEIRDSDRVLASLGHLPQIPLVASSLEDIDRRAQLLTPISEKDSLEDRAQHLRGNNPQFPQVRHWLSSMGPDVGDTPTVENSVLVSGSGSPPSVVLPHGKPCPEARPDKERKLKKPLKPTHKTVPVKPEKKRKTALRDLQNQTTPDAKLVETPGPSTNNLFNTSGDIGPQAAETKQIPDQDSSILPLAANPTESQRQHNIQEVFGSSPSGPRHPHSIQGGILVPKTPGLRRQHSLQDDVLVSNTAGSQRQRSLQDDSRALVQEPSEPKREPADNVAAEISPLEDKQHSLNFERPIAMNQTPPRETSLGIANSTPVDETSVPEGGLTSYIVTSYEGDASPPGSTSELDFHDRQEDLEPTVPLARVEPHVFGLEARVPPPRLLQPREHSLSRDIRVPSPILKGAFSHGIHLGESAPTPELKGADWGNDTLRDRRSISPNPASREHDPGADMMVGRQVQMHPRQHAVQGERYFGPTNQQYGLQADGIDASSSIEQ